MTNHLDADTISALSLAVTNFEGAIVLVSHDRSFVSTFADEFWLIDNGVMAPLDDYDEWVESLKNK